MLSVRDDPLVEELPRQPGQKETRWIHRLGPVRTAPDRDDGADRAPFPTGARARRQGRRGLRRRRHRVRRRAPRRARPQAVRPLAARADRRARRRRAGGRRRLRTRPDHRPPRDGRRRRHRLRPVARHGRRGAATVPRARLRGGRPRPRSRAATGRPSRAGTRSCTSRRPELPARRSPRLRRLAAPRRLARRSPCTRATETHHLDEWFGHAVDLDFALPPPRDDRSLRRPSIECRRGLASARSSRYLPWPDSDGSPRRSTDRASYVLGAARAATYDLKRKASSSSSRKRRSSSSRSGCCGEASGPRRRGARRPPGRAARPPCRAGGRPA